MTIQTQIVSTIWCQDLEMLKVNFFFIVAGCLVDLCCHGHNIVFTTITDLAQHLKLTEDDPEIQLELIKNRFVRLVQRCCSKSSDCVCPYCGTMLENKHVQTAACFEAV